MTLSVSEWVRDFWETLRDFWETLREFWETFERLLRDFWETFERLLRHFWDIFERLLRDSDLDWIMTLRSSDLQSGSDPDSIRNSCDVCTFNILCPMYYCGAYLYICLNTHVLNEIIFESILSYLWSNTFKHFQASDSYKLHVLGPSALQKMLLINLVIRL